ncbi:MAG: S41 family peptidase [Patescibacteria group bacterium]|nr:S41 family peptidase [Patescibacteria group bacterium]
MKNYTVNNKTAIISIAGIVLIIAAFFYGRHQGVDEEFATLIPPTDSSIVTNDQFKEFWQAWSIVQQKYVLATTTATDTQNKIYGAIAGMVASEGDPYTVFFPPQANSLFQSSIAGSFSGVGMEIDQKDGNIVVIAPLKNSPAEKAGIKSGDIIASIEGKSTANMDVDTAVNSIRGPKGSTVHLMVLHSGAKSPTEIDIVRDTIAIPTIDTQVETGSGSSTATTTASAAGLQPNGIFIIKLYEFTADSPALFQNALRQFVQSGSHKLILDLRGNPGGYLEAAWDMASYFLPSGQIVVTEDFGKNGKPQIYYSKGYNVFNKNLDMMILVDGGTASAAEILSGALEQHGVAKLVGTKTFGKGSVQELISLTPDTSLKVTVARWLTPNGTNLSENGLVPDYVVPLTASSSPANDPQMQKATQLLQAEP